MQLKLWKAQAPPPKPRTHKANSLQNPSLREKGGHGWNIFAHRSPSSFTKWHLSTAFIFAYLSSPWLNTYAVITSSPAGEKPAKEVPSFCSSAPGVPSPLPPRLRTLLQLPKNTSKSTHLTNLPLPWELRLGLSYSYTENFINHHCSSDVMGNYPVSPTKWANLSMLVVCAPGSHGDPAWPSYVWVSTSC